MKTILKLICSILYLLLLMPVKSQISTRPDSIQLLQEFQQQTEKWKQAYNSGDAKNLVPLYAPEANYCFSHVQGLMVSGRDKLIANFQNGINTGGHIDSIEILSINLSCELATLFCKYQATNSGQTVSGRNLLVLKKINGQWLIILHMTVV
jgi:ketosteroid isomerase-like protein